MLGGGVSLEVGDSKRCGIRKITGVIEAFARKAGEANQTYESDFLAEVNIELHFKDANR